jgi:hypothetical protein
MRRLIIDALYAQARLITYIADWFADPEDNIWRNRQRRLLQRRYQQFIPAHNCHESHATRPLP